MKTPRWRRKLKAALADAERYNAALTEAIEQARAEGATWQAIGDDLGMTAQGAFARYHRKADKREATAGD
jgi:hypothetical protein